MLTDEFVARVRAELPELPEARRARYRRTFGLPDYDIGVLTQDRALGDWFEAVTAAGIEAKTAANWVMTGVLQTMRERALPLDALRITPQRLASLLRLVDAGTLTHGAAQQVFAWMLEHDGEPSQGVRELGLERLTDPLVLQPLVLQAIEALPKAVADVRAGIEKPFDALKGHVMRATRGRADPAIVDALLRAAIGTVGP